MKSKKFKAEVLLGHKDAAVEVPFDPTVEWGLAPQRLWRGRHGHTVIGQLNGVPFEESYIVPRIKKFFLLINKEMAKAAGVKAGDVVTVSIKAQEPGRD